MSTRDGWVELPGGTGSVLAVAGEIRVAAELSRLRAWRGSVFLWLVEAPDQNPGRPIILADRVCWGHYSVDLESGVATNFPFARPPVEYLQTAHAWSPDGSMAIAAGRRRDPGGSVPAVAAWRLEASGSTTLWSGDDVPPVAVAIDGEIAVVGHRDPLVYRSAGLSSTALRAPTPPQRIDIQSARLLLVGSGELSVWDVPSGSELGRAAGIWMDACLTADGETVLAVDMSGRLAHLSVTENLRTVVVESQEAPMTAVATDAEVLLAAFARLPALRVRQLGFS
jgi:hypothetical protein